MMQTRIPAPAKANQQQSHSAQPATQLLADQQSTFEDHRPQAAQLISRQAMMSNSPPQQRTQTRQAKMNDSAQALQMRTLPTRMTGSDVAQREKLEEPLQAQVNGEAVQREEVATASKAPRPNNTGLPDNLKSGIESLSGMSMDHVKVHYNSSQPAQLNAHAYAQGSEIHVAPGQEQHVPHEAWHVVQQAQGRVKPTMQMKMGVPVNDDAGLESEADVMGAKAAQLASDDSLCSNASQVPVPAIGNTSAVAQRAMRSANIELTGPNETVAIEAHDTYASFSDSVTGANAVANTAPGGPVAAGTPAYVANVISTARGKDKTAAQVAAQYRAEAFSSPDDAARRFGLVYLANAEDKPWLALADQEGALAGASSGSAAGIAGFPVTAAYALWRRKWRRTGVADQTPAQIRTLLDRAANPDQARLSLTGIAGEVGWPSTAVPNQARNKAKEIPATGTYVGALNALGYRSFVHVGDADAVTMNVSADGVQAASSLFSRFDTMVANNPQAQALAGGYKFAGQVGPELLPPHSAGAQGTGADLMARTQQVQESSKLDMDIRTAMATHNASAPYFPEPNLLVEGTLYNQPALNFGASGPEWEQFRQKMIATKAAAWYARLNPTRVAWNPQSQTGGYARFTLAQQAELPASLGAVEVNQQGGPVDATHPAHHLCVRKNQQAIEGLLAIALPKTAEGRNLFAFDTSAALVTDVGRFDKEYVDTGGDGDGLSGTDYADGELDPLALFDSRALQSHSKKRSIVKAISNVYECAGVDQQTWMQEVLNIFLPQHLFPDLSNTRELGPDEETTRAAATTRAADELARVQTQLPHFLNFSTQMVLLITTPAPLTDRAKQLARVRLAVAVDAPIAPDQLTLGDKAGAIKALLNGQVHADFLTILREGAGQECDAIWRAVNNPNKPGDWQGIVTLGKLAGDAIAQFLTTFNTVI